MSGDRESLMIDAESVLLGYIKNGDSSYEQSINSYISASPVLCGELADTGLRAQALLIFCHLACRQAITGGLSPASAFSVCEDFVQSIGTAPDVSDARRIVSGITEAYVQRVHAIKSMNGLSDDTQLCISYIENNLSKKIRAADLAALTGVKEYSLTRRFMLETGTTVNDYIKNARVSRAKIYLSGSDIRIQEISASLGFSTPSYFSTCFKEVTGISPDIYRAENRRKN